MWDGGPVNNLGQVLHRCPALGGEEVVSAADSSSTDGPLIVGDHLCPYALRPLLTRTVCEGTGFSASLAHHAPHVLHPWRQQYTAQAATWSGCRTQRSASA